MKCGWRDGERASGRRDSTCKGTEIKEIKANCLKKAEEMSRTGAEGLPPSSLTFSLALMWAGLGKIPQMAMRETLPSQQSRFNI